MSNIVELLCSKIGSKLRVRIINSSQYSMTANCQFPRNLRIEGRRYTCKTTDITLAQIGSTWFYRIKPSGIITIEEQKKPEDLSSIKIFEDKEENICGICLDNQKCMVIIPCGHYFFCELCATSLTKEICPICRTQITNKIHIKEFEN